MYDAMKKVTEFHLRIGQEVGDVAAPSIHDNSALRARLLEEEVGELGLALQGIGKDGRMLSDEQQVVAVADALADISYVVVGSAVAWGIPLAEVFDEVHRSNMTKSRGNESTGGKAIKGPGYEPPEIERVLREARVKAWRRQVWSPECEASPWPPVFLERHAGEVHDRPGTITRTVGATSDQIQKALRDGGIEEIQTNETAEGRVSIARHRDGSFTVLEGENKSYHRDR